MRTIISLFVILALAATPAFAEYDNTYYGQEGTGSDGYGAINAAGQGPASDVTDNYTNWKYQYGSGAYSGIYSWDGDAWLDITETGDSSIEVECDIEMYWSETAENNKIYFHIGNPTTATDADKTAVVNGTYATNHPMYVGIVFGGTKVEGDINFTTGVVSDAMVGTVDIGGRDISAESFDAMFLCQLNGGGYLTPTSFGTGSHGTNPVTTLWWSPTVTGMTTALGAGTMDFLVKILPAAAQADGNYNLDPIIVAAPEL